MLEPCEGKLSRTVLRGESGSNTADLLDRPRDLEQRLGRIRRQGNINTKIDIYRYVTEATFDAYLYQTIENKQKFISQIMSSKSPVRSCEDVDETALSYAEIKALCAGSPLIKEKMDLDIEVARLKILKAEYQNQRYHLEDNIFKKFPIEIKKTKEHILGLQNDIDRIETNTHLTEEGISPMIINGVLYTNRIEAGEAIIRACKETKSLEPSKVGEYRGFGLYLSLDKYMKSYEIILKGSISYNISLGDDPSGNISRINNVLHEIPDKLKSLQVDLDNLYKQLKNSEEELKNPFLYEDELNIKSERLAVLDVELNMDNNKEQNVEENDTDIEINSISAKTSILETLKENKQIVNSQKDTIKKLPNFTI